MYSTGDRVVQELVGLPSLVGTAGWDRLRGVVVDETALHEGPLSL